MYEPRMLETIGERRVVIGAGESSEKCRRWRNMMCGLTRAYQRAHGVRDTADRIATVF